jgi:hypothetical protein
MDIYESLKKAKELGIWVHGITNNISVPNNKRTNMAVALFQQALDITDGIVVLLDNNLPGPAFSLARPMHEGYVRGVWLLEHASDESVEKFESGQCPKFPELLRQIGDEPKTGGAFIKGMTDMNLKSFHDLTHGGMEHVKRRFTGASIEPNYPESETISLLKARNNYSLLIACFLVLAEDSSEKLVELSRKQDEYQNVL